MIDFALNGVLKNDLCTMVSDVPTSEQTSERSGAQRSGVARSGVEQSGAERIAAERSTAEQTSERTSGPFKRRRFQYNRS